MLAKAHRDTIVQDQLPSAFDDATWTCIGAGGGLCTNDTANETGASLPVTALVDQYYKDVQKMGGGRWDTSSLFKRLRKLG